MCIVIDANRAADFCRQQEPYLRLIMKWVGAGGKIVSGGDLEAELFKVNEMRNLLAEWSKKGVLVRLPMRLVADKAAELKALCKSNDPHVIAVAIVGNADVIVTEDNTLISDMKNRAIGRKLRALKRPKFNPLDISRQRNLLYSSDC